ncbi:hypothetical protein ABPG75_003812 [Micractinium tetrahymenae]
MLPRPAALLLLATLVATAHAESKKGANYNRAGASSDGRKLLATTCNGSSCPDQPCMISSGDWTFQCRGGCEVDLTGQGTISCPDSECSLYVDCSGNDKVTVSCDESVPGRGDQIDETVQGSVAWTCN